VLPGADFAPPSPRCPGRPLRADSGLDGQVKPAAGRAGRAFGPGPGPARCRSACRSAQQATHRGRRRSPERKLGCCFCQRFTRRLDVVFGVNVVVDVSALIVSRKPLEEDSFLWRRPLARNWHPTGSHLKPGRRRAPHGRCKPAWSGRSAGSGPSGFQGSRLQPTRESIGEAKNE